MGTRNLLTAFTLAALVAAPAIAQEGRRRPRAEGQARPEAQPERPAARERAVPRTCRAAAAWRRQQARRTEPAGRAGQARSSRRARTRPVARTRAVDPRTGTTTTTAVTTTTAATTTTGTTIGATTAGATFRGSSARPPVVRVVGLTARMCIGRATAGGSTTGQTATTRTATRRADTSIRFPDAFYGGVRITGVPRDARVFADGYYVGIVNDFDGIFQHLNLEAGPHHVGDRNGWNRRHRVRRLRSPGRDDDVPRRRILQGNERGSGIGPAPTDLSAKLPGERCDAEHSVGILVMALGAVESFETSITAPGASFSGGQLRPPRSRESRHTVTRPAGLTGNWDRLRL